MKSHYHCLTVQNVKRDEEDLLTTQLFELGASGVSEDLEFVQTNDIYEPETIESDIFNLKAYFENEVHFDEIKSVLSQYESMTYVLSKEPVKDWLVEWKKGFHPFELVNNIWVVPTWLEAPSTSRANIFIDPGMAFGTGTHATTQLAAQAIFELKSNNTQLKTAIDVGTGTAILAMLCEVLGFRTIQGTEIDETARVVGQENMTANKMKHITILDKQIEHVENKFDLVIANIIDGVLLKIQTSLKRACKPGGFILLTGVLSERKPHFLKNFTLDNEFDLIKTYEKEEWLGFLFKRRET